MNTASLLMSAVWKADGLGMARHRNGAGESEGLGIRNGERPESSGPFDRWLNEKLVVLYNSVLDEPIPEDLLKLINSHRRS